MTTKKIAQEVLIKLQRNSVEARQIGIIRKAIEAAEARGEARLRADYLRGVEKALREQVEECAQVCISEIGEAKFNDDFDREGETVRRIVARIRALAD